MNAALRGIFGAACKSPMAIDSVCRGCGIADTGAEEQSRACALLGLAGSLTQVSHPAFYARCKGSLIRWQTAPKIAPSSLSVVMDEVSQPTAPAVRPAANRCENATPANPPRAGARYFRCLPAGPIVAGRHLQAIDVNTIAGSPRTRALPHPLPGQSHRRDSYVRGNCLLVSSSGVVDREADDGGTRASLR